MIVTACGSGDQSEITSQPPDPRGKPKSINKDEASSAQALFLTASLAYLQQSVHDLVSLGSLDHHCRRVHSIGGVPKAPKSPSAKMRMVLNNLCANVVGFEDFSADQVRLINDNERLLKIQFDRASLNTYEPLKIQYNSGRAADLMMQNQLSLELSDATANVYNFRLTSRWITPHNRNRPGKIENGLWTVNLSGRIRAIGHPMKVATTEIYDLVASVESEFTIPGSNRSLNGKLAALSIETSSLNASTLTNKVHINSCGYPEANWGSVYLTSLFPGEQLDLNFSTLNQQLHNLTTKQSYNMNQCTANGWALNGLKALVILARSRGR